MYIIRRPVVHLSMVVDSSQKAQTPPLRMCVSQMRTCTQPQQEQVLLYPLPQETSPRIIPAWAPAVIRPSSGPLLCLSLNLLLLNFDQLATSPLPKRFPERSANSDERRKLQPQHLHQRGTANKGACNHLQIRKSIAAGVSLSLGASAGEIPHREIWRRERGGYEILTQRAILSRSDLGCLTCAAVQ